MQRVIAANSRPPVSFPEDFFLVLGGALLQKAQEQQHEVLAVSVDHHHAHVLAKLPIDRSEIKRIVGTWKQHASHAVRDRLPGRVWASSGDPIRVTDRGHQLNVFNYIVRHGNQGAWVWTFRDG
ncbi:MAG: transposase [Planctomycetota bacterium]